MDNKECKDALVGDALEAAAARRHYDELDRKRVDMAANYLAQALNLVEAASDTMDMVCEAHKWNDAVVYQMKEASTGLGFALATLVRWNDESEDDRD